MFRISLYKYLELRKDIFCTNCRVFNKRDVKIVRLLLFRLARFWFVWLHLLI